MPCHRILDHGDENVSETLIKFRNSILEKIGSDGYCDEPVDIALRPFFEPYSNYSVLHESGVSVRNFRCYFVEFVAKEYAPPL